MCKTKPFLAGILEPTTPMNYAARRSFLCLISLLLVHTAKAQSSLDQSTATPEASTIPAARMPIQRVGPDDLISVDVTDSPELTRNFRISGDGTLALPMLKQRINVTGKETPEIEKQITDALVKEQILVQPVVSVAVVEYRSVPVSVLGAVRHPITFQAVGDVMLLDALTRAEGLAPTAGQYILISRPRSFRNSLGSPDSLGSALVERVSVKQLIDEADPSVNIRLYGGEEVRVPDAGRVYVLGNVRHSGAFALTDNENLTVLKVIAQSEGLLPYSTKQAFIYRRETGTGSRNEIAVELHQIIDRKAPDVTLQANDIFYVPDNKHRRIAEQTLEKIVTSGAGTLSGYLIWH